MSVSDNVERERKFLVTDSAFLDGHSPRHVAQSYLVASDEVELRVRVSGDTATLTVKSADATVSRAEHEYVLTDRSLAVALAKSSSLRIAKDRYDLVVAEHVWSVDVFQDENVGLILAEVEFDRGDVIVLPEWVDAEVTGDYRYYNRWLAERPYNSWPRNEGEA